MPSLVGSEMCIRDSIFSCLLNGCNPQPSREHVSQLTATLSCTSPAPGHIKLLPSPSSRLLRLNLSCYHAVVGIRVSPPRPLLLWSIPLPTFVIQYTVLYISILCPESTIRGSILFPPLPLLLTPSPSPPVSLVIIRSRRRSEATTSLRYQMVACVQVPVRKYPDRLPTAWGYLSKLFERSEFLIDTSQKKSLRVCLCARVHACSTNLGFSVRSANRIRPVSYTHLTLPTICSV